MTNKEIQELKERVYAISYSGFPLDSFFNDIGKNDNPRFNKNLAYKDLKLIVDEIYDLREKAKKYDEKETPEKTIKEPIIRDRYRQYRNYCPICKQDLLILGNYCLHCGQKVDWS